MQNRTFKQVEVCKILQMIFPHKKIKDNPSFLTFYKKYFLPEGDTTYTFKDLVTTAALVMCSDLGIDGKYLAQVMRIKEDERKTNS